MSNNCMFFYVRLVTDMFLSIWYLDRTFISTNSISKDICMQNSGMVCRVYALMSTKWKMTHICFIAKAKWIRINIISNNGLLCEDAVVICYTKQVWTNKLIIMSCEHWRFNMHMAEFLYYYCCCCSKDAQTPHGIVILIYSIRIHMNEATKSNKPKGINDAHNILQHRPFTFA